MTAAAPHAATTRQAAQDPAFPGLAAALAPSLVARLLAREQALPRGAEVAIRHARYQPGRGAWIAYETKANGVTPGRLFYGRLDPPGSEPLAGHERDGAAAADTVVLGDIPMVVRFFPHDAVLRRLPRICTLREIKRQVEEALTGEGIDWKIKQSTARGRIIRYKPERRCVFRLHFDARGRASGRKRRLALYGQVDADGAGERVARLLETLSAGAGFDRAVAVPRLVLHDAELALLLQEEIEGTPLLVHLDRDDSKKVVRRLAGRLVEVQRSGARPGPILDIAGRLAAAEEVENALSAVAEAAARGLDAEAGRLRRALAARAEPSPVAACLHGDFHAGQVLVRGRRSWIVDFDRAATGDPLVDPATFVAGLRLDAAEGRMARDPARRAGKIFIRAYAEAWPSAFDPARLRWQVAATLLAAAIAPLRQLRAAWPEHVARRLELAAAVAAGGEMLP